MLNFVSVFNYSWPGASLILIRGHRHLHECAYIGDDSSEELEELIEIAEEKGILNLPEISSPESPANRVELLTRHRPEVQFHDQRLRDNAESYTFPPKQDQNKDSEDNISGKVSLLNCCSTNSVVFVIFHAQLKNDSIMIFSYSACESF